MTDTLTAIEKAKLIASRLSGEKRPAPPPGDDAIDGGGKRERVSAVPAVHRTLRTFPCLTLVSPPQSSYDLAASQVVMSSTPSQYQPSQPAPSSSTSSSPVVISVPNSVVGAIIGRGGESIKNIQNTTGCQVKVERVSLSNQQTVSVMLPLSYS